MDRNVAEEVNNKEEVPQLSIRLNNNENIKLPLSTFNNLLTQEITKFIKKNEKNIKYIIDFKKQSENVNELKSKFHVLEKQANVLDCISNRLQRDLKINEFAKPLRCTAVDKNTYVKIQSCEAIALGKRNKEPLLFTLSDSEEEKTTTNISTLKPKPGSKSTTNFSVPNVNDNNKVLSIYDAGKTLNNRTRLSTPFAKRKPGPKSKTMYVEERVLSKSENNNNKKSKTNLSECRLVTELKSTENPNPNSCLKISSKVPTTLSQNTHT